MATFVLNKALIFVDGTIPKKGLMESLLQFCSYIFMVTNIAFPLTITLMFLLLPCLPPFLGSWILPLLFGREVCELGPFSVFSYSLVLVRAIVLLLEYILWTKMFTLACLYIPGIVMLGLQCVSEYMQVIMEDNSRSFEKSWFLKYRTLQVSLSTLA